MVSINESEARQVRNEEMKTRWEEESTRNRGENELTGDNIT